MTSTDPARRFPLRFVLAFGVYFALLLVVVLMPQPEPAGLEHVELEIFGGGWLADALRNVVLFAPFGAGLRQAGMRVRFIGLSALSFSCAIEGAQLAIPGRFASPLDVANNTLGAWAGAALPFVIARVREQARTRPLGLGLSTCAAASVVLLATSWLAAPSIPAGPYYGGWTLDCCDLEQYRGEVTRARVGDVEIPPFGRIARSEALGRQLTSFAAIELEGRAGPRPNGLAPVLQIVDDASDEVLMIGVDGDDVVYHLRSRARRVGLHSPMAILPGALAGTAQGDAFWVSVSRDPRSTRVAIDGGAPVAVGLELARGWSLLWPPDMVPRPLLVVFDAAWLALLAGPAVHWCGRRRIGWVGVAGLLALVALLPGVGPLAPLWPWQWAWLVAVVLGVSGARRILHDSSREAQGAPH